MGRPRIHDEESAENLLAVAADLMRAEGQEALSVRRVAESAGTSHRAVYTLFGSKQGLMDAMATFGYQDLATRVNALPATDDPAADLVLAAQAFRSFAMSHPALFRLAFEDVSTEVLKQPRVVEAAINAYRALARRIGRARAAGLIDRDRSDADCIFAFHATCQGLASCELAAQPPPAGPGFWRLAGPSAFDAVWSDTVAAVVRGFALEPPMATGDEPIQANTGVDGGFSG